MKKRVLAVIMIIILTVGMMSIGVNGASYPLMMVDLSATNQTIPEGETGYIVFKIFPEFKNERYYIDILIAVEG